MPSRNSIIVLINYFGQWPEWINLFVESCKFNPDIHWLIHTDCGVPENTAPNVTFRQLSFGSYCDLVSSRLGIEFRPEDRYKLCDLKPALGVVHARDIEGYRFWGYGDLDVIYGDIRSIYTDELLDRYNVISAHEILLSGHFAILRNTPLFRNAFRRFPGWRESMMAPDYAYFDEAQFSRLFWKFGVPPGLFRHVPPRFSPYSRRALFREQYTTIMTSVPWHDGGRSYPQRWFWRRGRVTNERDGDRQFLYTHFMTWKSTRFMDSPPPDNQAAWQKIEKVLNVDWRQACRDGFVMSPSGIAALA